MLDNPINISHQITEFVQAIHTREETKHCELQSMLNILQGLLITPYYLKMAI